MCRSLTDLKWWEYLICADNCHSWYECWISMFSSQKLAEQLSLFRQEELVLLRTS